MHQWSFDQTWKICSEKYFLGNTNLKAISSFLQFIVFVINHTFHFFTPSRSTFIISYILVLVMYCIFLKTQHNHFRSHPQSPTKWLRKFESKFPNILEWHSGQWQHVGKYIDEVVQTPQVAIFSIALYPGSAVVQGEVWRQSHCLSKVNHPDSCSACPVVHKQ